MAVKHILIVIGTAVTNLFVGTLVAYSNGVSRKTIGSERVVILEKDKTRANNSCLCFV